MTINNQILLNVLGKEIEICSCSPMTGWFRDGYATMTKMMEGIIPYVV